MSERRSPLAANMGGPAMMSLAPANLMAIAAVIAPTLAVFAPLGEAGLLALLAALLIVLDPRGSLAVLAALRVPLALLVALSLWGMASTLWSVLPGHSLFEALRFLALSLAGAVVFGYARTLAPTARLRVQTAIIIGALLAFVLLHIERWDDQAFVRWLHGVPEGMFFLTVFDRGLVVLVLVAWPVIAILRHRFGRWAAALVPLLMLLTLFAFYSQAAALAMVTGLAAAALAWRAPRVVAAMLIAGTIGAAFVLPAIVPDGATIARWHETLLFRNSGPHRLAIWHFVAERISERPILGWGMDGSRAIPGGAALVEDVMPELPLGPKAQILPLHPHNTALQWRLELGLPGTLIALAFVALVLSRAARSPAPVPVLAYAAAVLTVALLSFGAWQAWWLSSVWLGASFIAALGERTHPPATGEYREHA